VLERKKEPQKHAEKGNRVTGEENKMPQTGDRLMRSRETEGWMDKKLSRPPVQCSVVLVGSMAQIPTSPARHTHKQTHTYIALMG